MAKPLFKNYSYQFDKNERKVLTTFCKTLLKQISGDEKFYAEVRSFNSILEKLNDVSDEVKLTKDEKTRLVFNLKNNIGQMKKQASKGFFLTRWFYKSAYTQYSNLLENHFSD